MSRDSTSQEIYVCGVGRRDGLDVENAHCEI